MYICETCGATRYGYSAALRHSKGKDLPKDVEPDEKHRVYSGGDIDHLTGKPIRHILNRINEDNDV